MRIRHLSWQAKARIKVAETKSKIPKEWVLKQADLEEAAQQGKFKGPFIEQFLSRGEKDIIRNDSLSLIEKLKSQRYSAVEVAEAFCRTAAITYQIVSAGPILADRYSDLLIFLRFRIIVFME